MRILIKIILLSFIALHALAAQNYSAADLAEFHKNLRCLVCAGQTVYDSDADFAKDIKLKTEQLIAEGQSLEQIEAFYVKLYGPEIIVSKAWQDISLNLWLLPLILISLFICYVIYHRKQHR